MEKNQGKLFRTYRFSDGSLYRAEAGKDGVTDKDMLNLKNVIHSQYKVKVKTDRLETISIDTFVIDEDKNSELEDSDSDVELIVEISEEYEELHKAIGKLLPQQQELIYQIHFKDISVSEYARECGVTEGAIRDRLRKAYKQLKKYLKKF
jgi:RNA polymerase sigma factor (sigma-70 family)